MTINLPRLLIIELVIIASGIIAYFATGLLAQFGHLALIIAFSVLLTYALLPAVNRLAQYRLIPRVVSILIVYAVMVLTLIAFVAIISVPLTSQVKQFADDYPRYVDQLNTSIDHWQGDIDRRHIDYNLRERSDEFVANLEESTDTVVSRSGSIVAGFFGTLSTMFFILFVTAYFLHSGDRFVDRVVSLAPKRRQRLLRKLSQDYDRILGSFVRGHLLLALIVALVVGTFATVIGLPYSVIIAVIAGFTSLIPVIGALLGMVIPVIIAAFTNPVLIPVFVGFFLVFNEITDKVLYPRIVGRAVDLHPLIVLFGLLIGVQLAGVAGALLATPILALIKITLVTVRKTAGYTSVKD